MPKALIIYLIVINVATFIVYGVDKSRAIKKKWRLQESLLLSLAVIGGGAGAWLGMLLFRHKTQHDTFRYGVPIILALQIVALVIWILEN